MLGSDGRFTDVNPIACELLEYSKDELLHLNVERIFSSLPGKLNQAAANFEDVMIGKNTAIPVDINLRPIQIGKNQMYFAFCRDIRAKKRDQAKIQHMAYHDALTNLPNRWYIRTYLQQYIENKDTTDSKLGFILLDLDYFKVINDSLGHEAGDLLLMEVAKRLQSVTGNRENFLARFGGDEFILLVPQLISDEEASLICEKITMAMLEPFYLSGHRVNISTSIGISLYPKHGDNLNTLFKHSDIAMFDSKEQGRSGYSLYTPKMKQQANERLDLEKPANLIFP